jgi:subtilisin family serine protease/peptidase E
MAAVGCQIVASPRAVAQAAEPSASATKTPNSQLLRGDFGAPRTSLGTTQGEVTGTADLGDSYRRNAGESIRLLRATQEAALVVGADSDFASTVAAAVATGGLRGLAGREFSNLSGGRRIAVVQSTEPGRAPNATVLAQVNGVLGVQPVFVDPGSRVRMIPSGEVIVGLKAGVALAEVDADLKAAGLVFVERVGSPRLSSYLFRQSDLSQSSLALADRLFDHAKVLFASPNFIREAKKYFVPNDPLFPQQQHLHNTGQQGGVADADVDAVEAWDVSQGVSTVVIAIVDDGVDTTHPDLTIYNNPGETGGGKETNGIDDDGNGRVDDYRGWDFANGDNNPNPVGDNGHGTACSGVAAAKINNSYRSTGIAANCKIFPVKIFGDNGIATSDANIGAAISYAADFADVLSNSWGGGSPSAFIDAAITDAVTNGRGGKGCPVFFANGNSASIWGHGFFGVGSDLGAGTYSFGFRYQKDISIADGEDLIKIDNVVLVDSDGYTHLSTPLGTNGRQDFEGAFPPAGWSLSSSGGPNWSLTGAQTFGGTGGSQSPRSGAAVDNGWCELRSPNIVLAGDELLAVQLYISAESGYDGLILRIYNSVGTFIGNYGLISGVYTAYTPVSYPANHPSAISVGASTDSDRRSDYSEYGPETDFVAPSNGGWNDITTLDPSGAVGYSTSDFTTGFGGTSSATPLASGVGALLLSVNPNLTATQVRDTMRSTADKIGPVAYVGGFNNEYGFGRLNARAALDAISLPTVTVVAADNAAAEPSNVGRFVFTRTGPTTGSLTVNFTMSGTATSGSDYTALGTTIVFPVGSSTATNTVTPVDDAVVEATETVILTLAANAAYTVGSPSSATVNIADNDLPVVTVVAADNSAAEPSDVGRFVFTRSGPTTGSLTVNFTVGGTATSGSDYTALGSSIVIPAGRSTATNTVTPVDDAVVEATETVILTLAANATYTVGSPSSATVNIADNDLPVVTVVAADNSAAEPSDVGRFVFTRSGPTTGSLTVNFTVGGTATSGSDYTALGSSIVIPAGRSTATNTVTPIDDAVVEATETVILTLAANAAYTVGSPSSATVNIADNDLPVVTVVAADNSAAEPSDVGRFVFTRSGPTTGSLTVNFTVGGTATSGSDYTALGSSIVIPAGRSTATNTVTPVDDAVVEATETVILTLAANAAYTVGSPPSATVNIADDDSLTPYLTVDNADGPSRVAVVGSWTTSASTLGYWATDYLHDGNAGKGSKTVTLIPTVGTAGSYEVSVWYTAGSNRASNVPVDVIHAAGTSTVILNQRLGGGAWFSLGVFSFDTGTAGRVRIRTTGTDGFVIADAIRLVAQAVSPVVTVAASDADAGEPGNSGVFTFSRTGSTASPLTVNFTVGGTATSGSDYIATSTSITFGSGAASTNLFINVLDDASVESTESVNLSLAAGPGYTVGVPASATVNISDNDAVTEFLTVDNTDGPSRVEIVGAWTASATTAGFWGTDYLHDGNTGKGTKTVTYIPTVGTTGTYEAFIWYNATANRASNVPVDVIHAGGTTTRTVNQRINGSQWVSLGSYTFNSGTAGRVRLRTTATDGFVIADAIRLVPAGTPAFLTVDNANGPSRVELVGSWTASSSTAGYWGTDYLHDGNTGKGTKTATFIPTVANAGAYEAFIWYTAAANRASNLPVDIIHAGGTTTQVVNQRINGSQWVSLGIYTFNAGTAGRVRLRTTGTDGFVIADAIRLVSQAPALAGITGSIAADRSLALSGSSASELPRISAMRHDGRSSTITIEATGGATYALEASSDLSTWRILDTRTSPGAALNLVDPDVGARVQRFYRVRVVNAAE